MKAVVFAGAGRVHVDDVPPPRIQGDHDALVAVSATSICGSDLHLLSGKTPAMRQGGIIGHEFVGTVSEVGDSVSAPAVGTRVVGSFLIACGECLHCARRRFNHCVNRRALGLGPTAGDLDGAQAEHVRVPHAGVNLHSLEGPFAELADGTALFAGDILATGFYAAHLADPSPGETVVVIGAGPVGLSTALAARVREQVRVLVLDGDTRRVAFADRLGVEAVDVSKHDAQAIITERTDGTMADATIEAVGAADAFKSAMKCARNGGRVVVVGVYGKERYALPMGMTWIRGLDLRFSGMANVQNHWDETLAALARGSIDTAPLITHRLPLDDAEEGYELFSSRKAMKVLLTP